MIRTFTDESAELVRSRSHHDRHRRATNPRVHAPTTGGRPRRRLRARGRRAHAGSPDRLRLRRIAQSFPAGMSPGRHRHGDGSDCEGAGGRTRPRGHDGRPDHEQSGPDHRAGSADDRCGTPDGHPPRPPSRRRGRVGDHRCRVGARFGQAFYGCHVRRSPSVERRLQPAVRLDAPGARNDRRARDGGAGGPMDGPAHDRLGVHRGSRRDRRRRDRVGHSSENHRRGTRPRRRAGRLAPHVPAGRHRTDPIHPRRVQIMATHHVRHLAVTDRHKIVGVVSIRDLVKMVSARDRPAFLRRT